MKKLMALSVMVFAMNTFANSNAMMNTDKMVKEEKAVVEMMNEEVKVNLVGSKGETATVMINGDMAKFSMNGEKITLKRIVSASGEIFANEDKTVILGIKGQDAFFEMHGKVIDFKAMQEVMEEIVINFHSVKGEAHSHALVVIKGDHAFIRVDGMEYELERIMSASGEMFANKDKTVILGIKGTEAFVEMNGKISNYFQVGKASKGYANHMEHHHM